MIMRKQKDIKNTEIAIISAGELALVDNNVLNAKQLKHILKRTPTIYIKKRPAKGGGTWDYVTGGYMKKVLNLMFGFDWDFEIIDQMVLDGEVVVKGKLTCRCQDRQITKMQYGNKEIAYKKNTTPKEPLSIGNDFKAAATDALKKCASEIGIASDIYNKNEFKDITIADETENLEPELTSDSFFGKKGDKKEKGEIDTNEVEPVDIAASNEKEEKGNKNQSGKQLEIE